MMIEGTTIQVPFLADLVTMADPTSPYSFLATSRRPGGCTRSTSASSFYPLRAEYDAVLPLGGRAAAARCAGVARVGRARSEEDDALLFEVTHRPHGEKYCAEHLVLGAGTQPRACPDGP